jgi:hypothetical protein
VTTNNQRLLAQELQIKQLAEQTKHLVQIFTEHIASTSRQTVLLVQCRAVYLVWLVYRRGRLVVLYGYESAESMVDEE